MSIDHEPGEMGLTSAELEHIRLRNAAHYALRVLEEPVPPDVARRMAAIIQLKRALGVLS